MIKVQIDSKSLQVYIGKFPANMAKAVHLSLIQSSEKVVNRSKVGAPYWHGILRSSIRSKISVTFAEIGTDVIYAPIQEFGGHIYPKKSKFLRFRTRSGQWVTTKHVYIPPYRGKGYLRPALSDSQKDIKAIFERNISNQIK